MENQKNEGLVMSYIPFLAARFPRIARACPPSLKTIVKTFIDKPSFSKAFNYFFVLSSRRVDIDKILLGGEGKISGMKYAVLSPDQFLRPSTPFISGPHVKFLRDYEHLGPKILKPEYLKETEYYKNVLTCMHYTGHYFGFSKKEDIFKIAKKFIDLYEADKQMLAEGKPASFDRQPITIAPVRFSSYYQIMDGNHKAARAYMLGQRVIRAMIVKPACLTPAQDLLQDVLWLQGRSKEIYQPIELPEIKEEWTLVRACNDRLETMQKFLKQQKLMPGKSKKVSYLDVGASYGWFVKEMMSYGFDAYGVDRDYFSLKVGTAIYGLPEERLKLSDVMTYLEQQKKKIDAVSCFSVLHHYILYDNGITPEEIIRLLDKITGKVLFFEMGQSHEQALKKKLAGWDDNYILGWLRKNTTFRRIEIIGRDNDGQGRFKGAYGRALFACTR
jgi:2-polyprenyl-3-methyl-5-hydroxy-6-metoxy-1,4-benzoquinol methylase